jgi:alpha-D-xyloside xylohydrolase
LRTVVKAIDQVPVWGRAGHALPLGHAVQHTGQIDAANPIEELLLFGVPRSAPCVMGGRIGYEARDGGVVLSAVSAAQCKGYLAVAVSDLGASGVLARES